MNYSEKYQSQLKSAGLTCQKDNISQALYEYAKTRIPGGTNLFSKRPELFAPGIWPAYFSKAIGCETWDLDGNHYYDMTNCACGACLLGYRDPDVTEAVQKVISEGSICMLNPPQEVELADLLCEIHPWAQQVRYARSGGETAAIAIRIARATTNRSMVAICGYHGWHDWYLAANLSDSDALEGHLLPGLDPAGVPKELRGTTVAFRYNDFEGFESIIKKYGDKLAAVVMEPCRYNDPKDGFLQLIREKTRKNNIIMIFDEITVGWRLCLGGAHRKLKIEPDMALFGKTLSNGFPMGSVIGTKEAMAGANKSFISSSYWTEAVGPTASVATIKKMQKIDVPSHVAGIGQAVTNHWQKSSQKHGLKIITGDGYPALAHFKFEHNLANEMKTLYTQLMLERGFLAGTQIYPMLTHDEKVVSLYGQAIDEVFSEIANALSENNITKMLKGSAAQTTFARLL